MKKVLTLASVLGTAALLSACGGTANNAVSNSNLAMNSNRSTVNSATNTLANAANTVANTVSNTAASLTTPSPEDFMKKAAQGGMAEVELGKLAAQKGQNAEVKSYGQMMVADHGKANTELKALAAKKNVTLPADLGSHATVHEKLKTMSGAEFDKTYVDAMVDDHETTVSEFQKQADSSADADVKAFAAKALPTLKAHLEKIKAIQAKMP